jgi:hypothetical protein
MKTQAQHIVCELRRGWRTYGDLQALRLSQCPWKRISEAAHRFLAPGEVIKRKVGDDGLLRLRVVRG